MGEIAGIHYRTGEVVRLRWENGKITQIRPLFQKAHPDLPFVAPGLVDLQINGYGGLDFNTLPLDVKRVAALTKKLWQEGVTTYFPTIVTNSDEAIEQAVKTISAACEKDGMTAQCIAGIHLEGPFISPEDGPRGAHDKAYVKRPDWSLFQKWQKAAGGNIRIVTLSPEWPESMEFIRKCAETGVTVSIGHTAATPEQIREAVAAGARMSTHLGNGAHLKLPRHPHYIWEQLAQDELWACMIADRFHLPESVLKVFLRAKGPKAILVSDVTAFGGMQPGVYAAHIGGKVVLTAEGKLHLADHPELLAGSAQTLKRGVENLTETKLCSLAEAWDMASVRPAACLRLPCREGLTEGAPADLVLFRKEHGRLRIVKTVKGGQWVYDPENGEERFQ